MNIEDSERIVAPKVNLTEFNLIFNGVLIESENQLLPIPSHVPISSSRERLFTDPCESTEGRIQITSSMPFMYEVVCTKMDEGTCFQRFGSDGKPLY